MTPDTENRWRDWPVCPACQQRRQAICPVCQVAGDEFPLAEYVAAPAPMHKSTGEPETEEQSAPASDDSVLLLCPTCDEVFAPRFYRKCQSCGHDFGKGIDLSDFGPDEITTRSILVLVGLAMLLCGVLFYFWLVLRK